MALKVMLVAVVIDDTDITINAKRLLLAAMRDHAKALHPAVKSLHQAITTDGSVVRVPSPTAKVGL